MKISEHLDITLNLEKSLSNFGKDNLSKSMIDNLFEYSKSLNEIEFSELFEHKRPGLIYKEYKNSLERLKFLIHHKKVILGFNKISNLIDKESNKERIEYDYHYKKLLEVSSEERKQKSVFENAWTKYEDDSIEYKRIEKDYDEINKKYKVEQDISYSLYQKWESKKSSLFYLLDFKPNYIINRIENIEFQLMKLNTFEKYVKKLLKDERSIITIYKIFVELKLIKHIGYVDFTNQFLGNEIMTLEKEQKKDRNIAYAINCIANEFVLSEIATKWKKDMVNYFDLKDFEKKINPSEENKNETDKEIDNIILLSK